MDLFNQTLNGFSAHLAVSFNPDIFETNIINITLLLGGIVYLGSSALSESLSERQEKIMGAIQEAEDRLQQADKTRITTLETENTSLKARVTTLESQLTSVLARLSALEGQ